MELEERMNQLRLHFKNNRMNIIGTEYDQSKGNYIYFINKGFPVNCKVYNYDAFSQVDLTRNFILFVGCVYYGVNMGIANSLGEIASKVLNFEFYFKMIFEDAELSSAVPKEISNPILPVILFVSRGKFEIVANGPIHKNILHDKIKGRIREMPE
jgi:hypothetical protein